MHALINSSTYPSCFVKMVFFTSENPKLYCVCTSDNLIKIKLLSPQLLFHFGRDHTFARENNIHQIWSSRVLASQL